MPVPESPANSAVIPRPPAVAAAHPPLPDHLVAVAGARGQLVDLGLGGVGQDQVVPVRNRLDAPREPFEAGRVLGSRAAGDVGDGHRPRPGDRDASGRLGRAHDLLRREPERERDDRRVELDRTLAVERAKPELVALGDRGHGRLEQERRLARPGRVPRPVADQDHRRAALGERPDGAGAALRQRLDRAGDDARPAQPRFAGGRRGHVARVVVGPEAREIELEDRPPERAQRRRRQRASRRAGPLVDVDQRNPGVDRAREQRHVADRRRNGVDEQVDDRGVGLIVAEQMRSDSVGDAQRAREERPVPVLHQHDPAGDERAVRPEPDALDAARHAGARARQLDGEARAGPAARDVVVEVAVQPLEARVEIRRERDQQQLDVVRVQLERASEAAQPDIATCGLRFVGRPVEGREGVHRRGGPRLLDQPDARAGKQAVDLGVGDVQATEAVAGIWIVDAAPVHGRADARLDDGQPPEKVGERRVRLARPHLARR